MSCDKRTRVTRDGLTFDFSDNLGPRSRQKISGAILFQLQNLNPRITDDLAGIDQMRIDSIPYAYMLFIPFQDSINGMTKEVFDVFAITLSEDRLDNTPVHIILTDDDFKPLIEFPFHRAKVNHAGHAIRTSRTYIGTDSKVPQVQLGGIEIILLSELSELYKGGEQVVVELRQAEKGINIDITIDDAMINVDTLNSQFSKMDLLPWHAIFDGKPFRFLVLNKSKRIVYKSI